MTPTIMTVGWISLSLVIGLMGVNRKMGFWGYFFGSLLLGPIIGLFLLLASDKRLPVDKE
ncbi:membrane protein [Candidatus Magnetomorum sp. HK-1]|nr:membrane protein [Candidatus Magnetomorum sp. HK-1]